MLRERLAADAAAGKLREGADAEATANLVAAVTVGLEALGRENESWWEPQVTTGIWELLLHLAGADDETATEVWAALRELRETAEREATTGPQAPGGTAGPAAVTTAEDTADATVLRLPTHADCAERIPTLARASSFDG